MIDIILINYKSYWLLDQQIKHWETYMKGDFRLVIVDNTPEAAYQPFYYKGELLPRVPGTFEGQFDGVSSGISYDYALSLCTSDLVGMHDPDAFFFNPNILAEVEEQYRQGFMNIGAQGFYPDWQRIIDTDYPNFAGHLAPVLWTMFIDRKLAADFTFICNFPGIGKITGWEVRQHIIDNKIPNIVWPGFFPAEDDLQVCFFGPEDKPQSCHLLKGSSSRAHLMPEILPKYLEMGKAKWLKENSNGN